MTTFAWIIGAIAILLGAIFVGLALFAGWTARKVEKIVPPLGRFIDVDGARIHYVDEGTGPVLVLVHGIGGQVRNFTHSLLDRLKNEYRVIILDRPGSGYSTRAKEASEAIPAQAGMVARFIEALGLERPLLVGHSLGGAIALALALDHPDRVGGLALIAPATQPETAPPRAFASHAVAVPWLRWLIAWTMAVPASIAGSKVALAAFFGPQEVPKDFAVKGGGLLGLRPRSFIAASRDLVASAEGLGQLPARYRDLNLPVGVIFGTEDRILDCDKHGKGLATAVEDADLELIEGGGHMILIASADRSADFIKRMAQRVGATTVPSSIAEVRDN